jgi:hypothetical protein
MATMAGDTITLDLDELREVTRYSVVCGRPALPVFEAARPTDPRARVALEVAQEFADGARRTKAIRDGAWAAHQAAQDAREAGQPAADEAARAAVAAAGAAFLHPLARATQVRHILGAATHAARAMELAAGDDPAAAAAHLACCEQIATPVVVAVLRRYPPAPAGGGRTGALMRRLDAALR